MKTIKRYLPVAILTVFLLLLFCGCVNKEIIEPCLKGHTYGFWGGLWHGIIAPVDFVGMLLGKDVVVYAQNTNGAWYAFGFLLGSGGWGFLGGKGLFGDRKCK